MPTLPAAGQGGAPAPERAQGDEANASKANKEEGKRDPAEKAQGQASTGNSSNHNPGSPPTDAAPAATPAAARHTPSSHSAPFDPKKAIKEAMDKVATSGKEKYPRFEPLIKMNLKYRPMEEISQATHYYKYVPEVFSDALNFDFADSDYELVERDKQFLRELNAKIEQGNGTISTNAPGQTVKQE